VSLSRADIRRLGARLGGRLAHREDALYPTLAASPFPNLEVPWHPELVVRCDGVSDVIEAVRFAAAHEMGVAVRGGGVGWAGARPRSLLIDLADLHGVRVDPDAQTVQVQGGATWGRLNRELGQFGLAAAAPQFPRLGVAGHVLGGGHGWLSGRLGWASDTLRAAELVTASGELVRADGERRPDLLWALRGAGTNFGVVVWLELEVIPLAEVTFGLIWFHPDRTAEALALYREWAPRSPDELTTIVSVAHPPPAWSGPDELRGRAAAHLLVCHCGTDEQAREDLAAVRCHPGVVADEIHRMPWRQLSIANDVFIAGVHRRSRMHYLREMDDQVIDITARRALEMDPLSFMSTHFYGGALARVDEHATAMSHRDKAWNYMVATTWTSMQDGRPLRRWQDDYLAEIAERSHNAYYVNYLFDEPAHVPAAYAPQTWERLRELKQRWDPENRFADNQNIPPLGGLPG